MTSRLTDNAVSLDALDAKDKKDLRLDVRAMPPAA